MIMISGVHRGSRIYKTPPPHPGTSGCSRAPATSPKPPAPPEQPRRRRLPGPDAGRVEGLGQFRAVFLAVEGFRGLGVSGSLGVLGLGQLGAV